MKDQSKERFSEFSAINSVHGSDINNNSNRNGNSNSNRNGNGNSRNGNSNNRDKLKSVHYGFDAFDAYQMGNYNSGKNRQH